MSQNQNKAEDEVKRALNAYGMSMASVGAQVGCLTVLIILVALFVGLWLDGIFHTKPTITLILIFGSVPVTLVLMFWVVKNATKRMVPNSQKTSEEKPEDSQVERS